MFVVLLTTVLGAAAAEGQEPTPQIPTIVTVGEANIRRSPDQAILTFAVETRAKLPRDAQRLNATAMTSVERRLTELSIAKDAIRTTGFTIEQEFDYANGKRTPREFAARNGVEVRLDAIERAGEVLDAVVQAGATSVSGVRFDLKERIAVERDALRHAVEDARARADALAAGAGRTVDRVLRIDDGRRPPMGPPQPMVMAMRAAPADAAQTPIEPGTIEIHAQVTLTVSIK
jgi:uncharacterized protein YggE